MHEHTPFGLQNVFCEIQLVCGYFFPSEVSKRKKGLHCLVDLLDMVLWCEVMMVKHMHVHICASRLVLKCLPRKKLGWNSLLKRIIGIPFIAPLPCNRPHTGKDTTPAESQCCAPDVPTCCSKCDTPTHPFLALLTTYLPLITTMHWILTGLQQKDIWYNNYQEDFGKSTEWQREVWGG